MSTKSKFGISFIQKSVSYLLFPITKFPILAILVTLYRRYYLLTLALRPLSTKYLYSVLHVFYKDLALHVTFKMKTKSAKKMMNRSDPNIDS